ncbi:hypothetical protein JOD31_000836 [Methylopila capsulata]|uniref:Uncharacterized protein n=1 Tax=Methylopila capsulata TaxID=61654 RepID=A0A9W6MS51_9HYPH|nr:DUF6477 family protein [Methylopila capsulata]MBM7850624.1 hypothetical protein [Methylopila capsulata]GLK55917.1 hypothetical protein GCM10008170_19360 [Methylopila capsulata]
MGDEAMSEGGWKDAGRGVDHGRRATALQAAAHKGLEAVVRAGAEAYDRRRHLPRLIPCAPGDLETPSRETRQAIVDRLAAALEAERRRGRDRCWTYDLNRHIALAQAYAAETSADGLA